jgi:hypothetical protein
MTKAGLQVGTVAARLWEAHQSGAFQHAADQFQAALPFLDELRDRVLKTK